MNSAIHDQNVAKTRFGSSAQQSIRRRDLIDVAMGKTPAEAIIQGGRLVNVATAEIYPADVAIKGGRIAAVGDVAYTKGPQTRIIDATGRFITPGLVEAFGMSITKNYREGRLIFQTIWGLLTRETSPKQLMGPLGIAQLSGESAQLGWASLFSLMAMLSLNLGLLNILPIPILDGGHIAIMALEGLARRDFSFKVKEKMLLAGFVVLMVLMVTVIYNDLARISWLERFMPGR